MSRSLRDALVANLAESGDPKHRKIGLARVLAHYLEWRGGSTVCPSAETAANYLAYLTERHGQDGAQARFASFQIAAAYAWGARETRHLAVVMRGVSVADKAPRLAGDAMFAPGLARLPLEWRPSFERVITVHLAGVKNRTTAVHWSKSRIKAVLASLGAWAEYCRETNIRSAPNGAGFENYADALAQSGAAAVTIVAYLERILAGHRAVITPGWDSLACRLVIDDWTGRSENEPSRKAKTERIVGASTLYQLGLDMIEEARNARFIGLHAARLFRSGLLLALGVSLPQRARALSHLAFGKTIFLEPDFTIRIFLPGTALKRRETRKKAGKPYARTFRNPALWQALRDYREIYRPLYDDGAWLWPSQLSRSQGISEKQVGRLCGDVTERRLKVRVSVHDLRDNVVSEATEEMEHGGRLSPILLDHTDPRVTEAHYDQSEDIAVAQEFGRFMQSRRPNAESLRL